MGQKLMTNFKHMRLWSIIRSLIIVILHIAASTDATPLLRRINQRRQFQLMQIIGCNYNFPDLPS